jgi:hypothetical protein
MDDFDDGGTELPDEMSTELPDLDVVDAEVEIDIEGTIIEPAGRTSGGARAHAPRTPRKSSRSAPKAAAKKAAAPKKAAKKAAAKRAKPARKKAAKKSAPKKAKRKAGAKK